MITFHNKVREIEKLQKFWPP